MTAHVSRNSGDNEWYTPPAYIEAARATMGSIDTDPASSVLAQETVKADVFFTAETDGLLQPWYGNVWLNPPYSAKLIRAFVEKLARESHKGNVKQFITLTNNATETAWFQELALYASALCLPAKRIRFTHPSGKPSAPLQGQAVIYMGPYRTAFHDNFRVFGLVFNGGNHAEPR